MDRSDHRDRVADAAARGHEPQLLVSTLSLGLERIGARPPYERFDFGSFLAEMATLCSLVALRIGLVPRPIRAAPYPDIWAKAASLLQSVVGNHALIDGNKRLGRLTTAVFLELNGHSITAVQLDAVYELVSGAAMSQPDIGEIATALKGLAVPRSDARED